MTNRVYGRRDVEDFFRTCDMAPRDALLFGADLSLVLNESRGDHFSFEEYAKLILTLSDKGWYQRQSDTLTRAAGHKADSPSHGEGCLMDSRAAARKLGLTDSQFRKLVAKSLIPFVPVTGIVKGNGRYQHKRFRAVDLEQWAADKVVEVQT